MGASADEEVTGAGAEVAGAVLAGAADVVAIGAEVAAGLAGVGVGLLEHPNTKTVISRIANTRVSLFIKLPPISIHLFLKTPVPSTNCDLGRL
jgi:hypothetical protein